MSFRYEVRLSGDVGHGLIMVGKILAEAAAIYDNHNAIQSQSYGEESRGEANRSDVIISDGEIIYPKVENPDILLCLTQTAYDKYIHSLKPKGILIVDSLKISNLTSKPEGTHDFPIFLMSKEQFGSETYAGIISMGLISDFLKVISPTALQQALLSRIPKGSEKLNERAFKLGIRMAKEERGAMNVD